MPLNSTFWICSVCTVPLHTLRGGRSCAKARRAIRQKVWTRTTILSPKIHHFVAILRFVVIYALFGRLLAKKCPFFVNISVSWVRSTLLHGTYCILYWTEFANLQLRAKTTIFLRKWQLRAWRKMCGHFRICRKPANFCHPASMKNSTDVSAESARFLDMLIY